MSDGLHSADVRALAQSTLTWREAITYPDAIDAALSTAAHAPDALLDGLLGAEAVIFTGAGSSYYLARTMAWVWREETSCPATAMPLSEILLRPLGAVGPRPERTAIVVISRSGETSDAVAAAAWARAAGAFTVAVTCRPASSLAAAAPVALVSPRADERAIVMTRSFTSMLALLLGITARAATRPDLGAALSSLAAGSAAVVAADVDRGWELASAELWSRVVILGGGALHGIAMEAGLKIVEMSQLPTDAYEPLELRHGPISICEPGVLLVGLFGGAGEAEERRVLDECAALGASTWAPDVGTGRYPAARLPLYLPPLQALALGIAVARGRDPDRPRHLSQVVVLP